MLGSKMLSTSPVRVCSVSDPAIDREKSDVQMYALTKDDSLIHPLPGRHITWFHVRRLSRSVALEIDASSGNEKLAQIQGFRLGVVRVEHLERDDGRTEDFVPECRRPEFDGDPNRGLTRDELDLFSRTEVYEIGDLALKRADLRRGRQPFFVLPESSVRALGEQIFLHADDPVAVSLRQGQREDPSTRESFENGESPTDVTATGE